MSTFNTIINNRKFITVTLFLYALMIFILSHMSFKDSGTGFQFNDKFVHFIEYMIFGYLLIKYFYIVHNKPILRSALFSVVSGGLFAISDEIHQGFVGYFDSGIFGGVRNPDIFDFISDISGITFISIIFILLYKNKNLILKPTIQE